MKEIIEKLDRIISLLEVRNPKMSTTPDPGPLEHEWEIQCKDMLEKFMKDHEKLMVKYGKRPGPLHRNAAYMEELELLTGNYDKSVKEHHQRMPKCGS